MKSGLNFLVAAKRCEIAELQQLALTSALVNVTGRLVHGLQR
ncbi:MAG: antitermination regulator, partial [Hydrogenophaga sp.]|nr:antitermination regulator [Hydrogenophaga sp.]